MKKFELYFGDDFSNKGVKIYMKRNFTAPSNRMFLG